MKSLLYGLAFKTPALQPALRPAKQPITGFNYSALLSFIENSVVYQGSLVKYNTQPVIHTGE